MMIKKSCQLYFSYSGRYDKSNPAFVRALVTRMPGLSRKLASRLPW